MTQRRAREPRFRMTSGEDDANLAPMLRQRTATDGHRESSRLRIRHAIEAVTQMARGVVDGLRRRFGLGRFELGLGRRLAYVRKRLLAIFQS